MKKLDDQFHRGYLHLEKPEKSKTATGASGIHYIESDMKTYHTIFNIKRVQQDIETTLVYKYCPNNPMKICENKFYYFCPNKFPTIFALTCTLLLSFLDNF